ncbi:lycopene cyclase domain-containing protein [Aurantibacter crassamenti]|uniref:lycopene cyclase domain-containing protein n=1 Tax=Aurantibacter crassamenti TaxID=1837375 RepID=UPI0019394146|nr:lycopene cyclase domain-containing protein [Aurantibacter crassamenti]MBM1104814.1 lycopene cyclase domain-containing protein [Aurantibacter crassamenti]
MQSYTYLLLDICCIFIPFIASFYPKHAFYKEWKPFFLANFLVALFFLAWDADFTFNKIWGFNPDYLTGIYILNLPIEEILFFLSVPYACVFTYFSMKYLVQHNPLAIYQKGITIVLLVFLLLVGLLSLDKWYTSITSLLTAVYLLFRLVRKKNLSYHYLSYFVIFPFFFLSNGILTGSFIDAPIVWYNDDENLGIRLFTIPVEDVVYGMLLIFMNIDLYEYFKSKFSTD